MATVIKRIIDQHGEEAASLWVLRCYGIRAPQFRISDIARLDDRIEAHLDGLRIAGEPGWELCQAMLSNEEPGEVFTASVMAFEAGIESRFQAVLDVVQAKPDLSMGMISALGWLSLDQAFPHIQRLLTSEVHLECQIGFAASAVHRKDLGRALNKAVESPNLSLRARALRAVGELGRKDLLDAVKENLRQEDEGVCYWAAWSGSILGEPSAFLMLQGLVVPGKPNAEDACVMALRRLPLAGAHAWLKELANRSETQRLAVLGAGVVGDPVQILWLMEKMSNPELARKAGEAFTAITGADLSREKLDCEKPGEFESGPTDNPEDENVMMDPDDGLPWPNQELVHRWWSQNKARFINGTRYLLGSPMTLESLNQVLRAGKQRQRTAAAIELAIRQPGTPLFNTSAPGFRQQALLGLGR